MNIYTHGYSPIKSSMFHSIVIVVIDFTVVIVAAVAPGKRVKALGLHLWRTGKAWLSQCDHWDHCTGCGFTIEPF